MLGFLRVAFNSQSDGQEDRASSSGPEDFDSIQSWVKVKTLILMFAASLLDVQG